MKYHIIINILLQVSILTVFDPFNVLTTFQKNIFNLNS